MIIRIKNICILFLIITVVMLFCLVPGIMALEVETHRAINESIAKGSSLDDYLKKQLGMQDGKDTYFNNKKVFNIIGDRAGLAKSDSDISGKSCSIMQEEEKRLNDFGKA